MRIFIAAKNNMNLCLYMPSMCHTKSYILSLLIQLCQQITKCLLPKRDVQAQCWAPKIQSCLSSNRGAREVVREREGTRCGGAKITGMQGSHQNEGIKSIPGEGRKWTAYNMVCGRNKGTREQSGRWGGNQVGQGLLCQPRRPILQAGRAMGGLSAPAVRGWLFFGLQMWRTILRGTRQETGKQNGCLFPDALEIHNSRSRRADRGKRMFQGPLKKPDWVDYPGEGELAWGFGWRRCHIRRAMDGQPSLISEKSGKDGCTQAPLGEKCTCPQLERPCWLARCHISPENCRITSFYRPLYLETMLPISVTLCTDSTQTIKCIADYPSQCLQPGVPRCLLICRDRKGVREIFSAFQRASMEIVPLLTIRLCRLTKMSSFFALE